MMLHGSTCFKVSDLHSETKAPGSGPGAGYLQR